MAKPHYSEMRSSSNYVAFHGNRDGQHTRLLAWEMACKRDEAADYQRAHAQRTQLAAAVAQHVMQDVGGSNFDGDTQADCPPPAQPDG